MYSKYKTTILNCSNISLHITVLTVLNSEHERERERENYKKGIYTSWQKETKILYGLCELVCLETICCQKISILFQDVDKLISAEYFHAQDFPQFLFNAESVDMWIDSSWNIAYSFSYNLI